MLSLVRTASAFAALAALAYSHATTCHSGEVTLILNMTDAYGDGWNGAMHTFTHSDGSTTTGTLAAESWGTVVLCLTAEDDGDCHPFAVSAGFYPSEVGWSIVNEEGVETASGGAPTTVCIQRPRPLLPPSLALVTMQSDGDGDSRGSGGGGGEGKGVGGGDEKIGVSGRRSVGNATTPEPKQLFGE